MVLANWTCAVVCTIETVIANNMPAWIQNMGSACAPAEKAGLRLCLEEMNEHLLPPESDRIGGNILWKMAEQRLMLLVGAQMIKQRSHCPCPEGHKFGKRSLPQAGAKTRR
jgi:hypothetical protein